MFTELAKLKDNNINTEYTLNLANAKELSSFLKDQYLNMSISINDYNTAKIKESSNSFYDKDAYVCHNESIYHYDTIYLLKEGDKYHLLDGYRRLFVFDVPDVVSKVCIYDRDKLSDSDIMSLIIDLNNYKIVGNSGGAFYDRGFALFMKSIFNLDILKYEGYFNMYMTTAENTYCSWRSDGGYRDNYNKAIKRFKDFIKTPNFFSDLRFVNELANTDYNIVISTFYITMNKFRTTNNDVLNGKEFIDKVESNATLLDLLRKHKNSPQITKYVNEIEKIYDKILAELTGGEVKETYAEVMDRIKKLNATIAKDKNLLKITKFSHDYPLDWFLSSILDRDDLKVTLKCVVNPLTDSDNKNTDEIPLRIGLYENGFFHTSKKDGKEHFSICFKKDDPTLPSFVIESTSSRRDWVSTVRKSYSRTSRTRQDVTLYIGIEGYTGKKLKEIIVNHDRINRKFDI